MNDSSDRRSLCRSRRGASGPRRLTVTSGWGYWCSMVDAAAGWRGGGLAAVVVVAGVPVLPAGAAARASARSVQASSSSAQCPWVDSSQPIAGRVSELIGQMSVAQEVFLVEGHGTTNEGPDPSPNPYVFWMPGIPSLCIPKLGEEDGPNGVADGLTGVAQLPG